RARPQGIAQARLADRFESLFAVIGRTRAAAAGTRLGLSVFARDRGGQHAGIEAGLGLVVLVRFARRRLAAALTGTTVALLAHERVLGRFGIVAFAAALAFLGRSVVAGRPLAAVARLVAAVVPSGVAAVVPGVALAILVVVIGGRLLAVLVVVAIVAARALLIVARRAAVGHHAEMVVGELQVGLGLHPVAVERGVVRQLLVLLE